MQHRPRRVLTHFLLQAVAFSTFASYTLITGKPLTSEIVFPAITLFSLLGFPLAVSIRRSRRDRLAADPWLTPAGASCRLLVAC